MYLKDFRVEDSVNQEFIDLLEKYFEQPIDDIMEDARPEYGYQVGVTPENVEEPRCKKDQYCLDLIQNVLNFFKNYF